MNQSSCVGFFNIIVMIIVSFSIFCCALVGIAGENCVSPRGDQGICRNIKGCKFLLQLLIKNKSRPSSWSVDYLRRSHCGFQGREPVVCCPHKFIINGIQELDVNRTAVKTPFLCGAIHEQNKITGGSETSLFEFPWMALIGYKTKNGLQYRCGGSLISPRYVLTAAHCVSSLRDITPTLVRLGEHNLSTQRDCEIGLGCAPLPKDVPIDKLIPHPDYFRPELRNDIALIGLAETVEIKNSIQPICLPHNKNSSERMLYEKALVTGWGTTETGIKSQILLKATLPIVSYSKCSVIYKNKIPISDSQICAGGEEGRDTCSGDSGGPLLVIGTNHMGQDVYIQQGIVSFGPRLCGAKGKPGVYTKVAYYTDWILTNMSN